MSTLIRAATVVDGTERPRYRADVLVDGPRIAAILPTGGPSPAADRVLDADGLVLAPGFIDMHAHSDLQILLQPDHLAKISQGVTTELLGQDGLSYAPVDDDALAMLRKKIAGWNTDPADFDFSWRTVGEYLERLDNGLEGRGIAGNAAYLVPHGVVRALVCGWEDVPASADDIVAMQGIVRAAMAEGAVGLSAGLTYTPGMYADNAELLALCRTVGELGGFFAPHHRSYGKGALDAYAEMIDLTTRAGCPLHLSHATMNFAPNKGRAGELLAMLDAAIADGADITLDTYPYLPGATTLSAVLPSWSSAGGQDATLARLRDPAALARIRDDLEVHGSDGCHGVIAEWDTIEISGVAHTELDGLVGRTVAGITADTGREPFAVFVDVLLRDELGTGILQHVGHEVNVQAIMRHPRHKGGSDGLLVGAKPHPRAWGTFPRYLGHYCRDLGVFSLEECVGHLTGRAAARLRLRDRGLVRTGYAADLVLFDPATVADAVTYADPRQPAVGIPYVFVNGELGEAAQRATGERARSSQDSGDGGADGRERAVRHLAAARHCRPAHARRSQCRRPAAHDHQFKLEPFIALIVVGLLVALAAGLPVAQLVGTPLKSSDSILENGFGGILGHIAPIIGLGTVLGAIMERSGGADALTARLLRLFGPKGAPLAMGLTGLIFGIPVFFDIGIFVLAPLVYVAAKRGGRSLVL